MKDSGLNKKERTNMFEELINKSETEINMMSPLTWAYVGDSVYEMYIRTYLSNSTNFNPHKMHIIAIKYVKAEAQAKILEKLKDELTDEEKDIVRRGRNTENHHLPKHASATDYMYATAFEALIGYLFLTKKYNRLKEVLKKCIEIVENN